MKIKYAEFKQRLVAISRKHSDSEASSAADDFEEAILFDEHLSDDAFLLLTDVFSEEPFVSSTMPGHFARVLATDFCKLSAIQTKKLLAIFIENHTLYADELSRHWVADTIARQYPESQSKPAFEKLHSASANGAHIAAVGLHLLSLRKAARS
jgi:hypothetical protein